MYPCLRSDPGAHLCQRRIRVGPHEPPDDSLSSGIQARLLATRTRLGGNITGGTVLAQHFLHEGKTHPEDVGNRALGAEVPLPSPQTLLT
jgi:hypothetical protein